MKRISHRPKRLKHALPTRPRSAPAMNTEAPQFELVRPHGRLAHNSPDEIESRVNAALKGKVDQ